MVALLVSKAFTRAITPSSSLVGLLASAGVLPFKVVFKLTILVVLVATFSFKPITAGFSPSAALPLISRALASAIAFTFAASVLV